MASPLPFDVKFYDNLYLNISVELREKYPQHQDETLIDWHRRLLHEFMDYLHAKYEPEVVESKVQANKKNNKKKKTPSVPNLKPTNVALFDTNVERALDIVTQDSDFACYLMAYWIPLLLNPSDYACMCLDIDGGGSPANTVRLHSIEVKMTLFNVKVLAINGYNIQSMTLPQFNHIYTDPFVNSIFRGLTGTPFYNLDMVKKASVVTLHPTDVQGNAFQTAGLVWKLKNIVKPLFIKELTLKSNLILEPDKKIAIAKVLSDRAKNSRKRFNARKFIKTEESTLEEMSAEVLQTLAVSCFRTFYDFDESTIDPELFDYLFKNKHTLPF